MIQCCQQTNFAYVFLFLFNRAFDLQHERNLGNGIVSCTVNMPSSEVQVNTYHEWK